LGKVIVTHLSPDLDAICAVWLLKKFVSELAEAAVKFVPAGETWQGKAVDADADVIHVDTGLGKFDHHQTRKKTCAAKLVYDWLVKTGKAEKDKALERLIVVVTEIDWQAADIAYPDAADDRYAFLFNERQIIQGWQKLFPHEPEKILELGMPVLDGIWENFKSKIEAAKAIKEGIKFETQWGKGVGAETNAFGFMALGQMTGFAVVVARDPRRGHIRIHGMDQKGFAKVNLTGAKRALMKHDPEASWYLHSSRHILINGSALNPKMRPTKLSLEEVIKVLKEQNGD
jgi:hypothetical protein